MIDNNLISKVSKHTSQRKSKNEKALKAQIKKDRRKAKIQTGADVLNADRTKREDDTISQPSNADFNVRIAQPKAHDAFFHGAAALPLLSSIEVKEMKTESQNSYINKVAEQSESLLRLVDEAMRVVSNTKEEVSIEEQLIADMMKLKNLPLARRYVEMTLWRRVKLFSQERVKIVEQLGYGSGERKGEGEGILLHPAGDLNPNFVSYRDAYLRTIMDRYQNDLEKIRESESLDVENTRFLLRCMESGADLFGNLKCIEDKQSKADT